MTRISERRPATSEWLKPLDQRVASHRGPRPHAVTFAAVTVALLTPLMTYLAVVFTLDMFDFATRTGYFMWVHVLGYGIMAVSTAALAVASPIAARRLFRFGESKQTDRIGLVIGGSLAFVLGLSIASNGRLDGGLFVALGPTMLFGFMLSWLVRRQTSQVWLQTRRRHVRQGTTPPLFAVLGLPAGPPTWVAWWLLRVFSIPTRRLRIRRRVDRLTDQLLAPNVHLRNPLAFANVGHIEVNKGGRRCVSQTGFIGQ
jgi:hypothetical protein